MFKINKRYGKCHGGQIPLVRFALKFLAKSSTVICRADKDSGFVLCDRDAFVRARPAVLMQEWYACEHNAPLQNLHDDCNM